MARLSSPPSRFGSAPFRLQLAPREAMGQRRDAAPWRRWYDTARWGRLRLKVFERDRFTCQAEGCGRIQSDTSQLVCDHVRPHRGAAALFWAETNLQTLCKSPRLIR